MRLGLDWYEIWLGTGVSLLDFGVKPILRVTALAGSYDYDGRQCKVSGVIYLSILLVE